LRVAHRRFHSPGVPTIWRCGKSRVRRVRTCGWRRLVWEETPMGTNVRKVACRSKTYYKVVRKDEPNEPDYGEDGHDSMFPVVSKYDRCHCWDHLARIIKRKRREETPMRNRFVSVVVEGNLDCWTGPNPDKFPSSMRDALERAKTLRGTGKAAYAVVVTEILPLDVSCGLVTDPLGTGESEARARTGK